MKKRVWGKKLKVLGGGSMGKRKKGLGQIFKLKKNVTPRPGFKIGMIMELLEKTKK